MTVLVGVISVNFVIVLDYLAISVMFNSNEESKIKNQEGVYNKFEGYGQDRRWVITEKINGYYYY